MSKFLKDMFDDRFGCPDVVDIYKCDRCRHCFCGPKLSPREIGALYEKYYGRKIGTKLYSRVFLPSKNPNKGEEEEVIRIQ